MRVAFTHLRHAHIGGVERYLNNISLRLVEAGHEVTIICRSHEEPPHPAVRFVQLKPLSFGTVRRRENFADAALAHVEGAGYDVVYELGLGWSHDLVRLGWGSWHTWFESRGVGVSDALSNVGSGLRARAGLRGAWSSFLHTVGDAIEGKRRGILRMERQMYERRPDALVLANSHFVANDIGETYGIPKEQLRVIHNGVDLERHNPRLRDSEAPELRRELGLSEDDVLFVFLGNGFERKGLMPLLRACEEVFSGDPRLKLLVVGKDTRPGPYQAVAREGHLRGRVRFLGPRRDVPAIFAAADLYLLPTKYDAFANTTLEALACGTPVITTKWNGGSEVIDPACGAVLDDSPLEESLAASIREWLAQDKLESARSSARQTAELHSIEDKMRASIALVEEAARRAQT